MHAGALLLLFPAGRARVLAAAAAAAAAARNGRGDNGS